MRHRGENVVVRSSIERANRRTAVLPRGRNRRDGERIRFRQRGQHHGTFGVQRRKGGSSSRLLGAGDRMRGNETRQRRAERRAGSGNHVLLGATRVGNDRVRAEMRRHPS